MITQFTLDVLKQSTKPIIIKAFATWCPHCAKMKPIFEKLAQEMSQYLFTEFDVDKSLELTKQFEVASLPTFIFIKNQKEVDRVIGEMSEEELKQSIEKNLP